MRKMGFTITASYPAKQRSFESPDAPPDELEIVNDPSTTFQSSASASTGETNYHRSQRRLVVPPARSSQRFSRHGPNSHCGLATVLEPISQRGGQQTVLRDL